MPQAFELAALFYGKPAGYIYTSNSISQIQAKSNLSKRNNM